MPVPLTEKSSLSFSDILTRDFVSKKGYSPANIGSEKGSLIGLMNLICIN